MSIHPQPDPSKRLAILGGGNIGLAIARGMTLVGRYSPHHVTITRRHPDAIERYAAEGFEIGSDNRAAVRSARTIVLSVPPDRLPGLLDEIAPVLDPVKHVVVSVVTGAMSRAILERIGTPVPVVLAMPNTAVAIGESMTCLSAPESAPVRVVDQVRAMFDAVGQTIRIDEGQMSAATALCACGIAFFLRAVRAASQGGIEIGFHPQDAILMAAQTARGAASLLLSEGSHPERQIDAVTTPRGCTIAGLNELEHRGFSSALIKGITTSAARASGLFDPETKTRRAPRPEVYPPSVETRH